VAAATAVSVPLNVAHAPDRLAAQLFAALPPVALLGALELLMSAARTGLPHTSRTPGPTAGTSAVATALDLAVTGRRRRARRTPAGLATVPAARRDQPPRLLLRRLRRPPRAAHRPPRPGRARPRAAPL
jgi:hypothetical protein